MLSGCVTALKQGRYTWRHDSVLGVLEKYIRIRLNDVQRYTDIPRIEQSFVRAGARPRSPPSRRSSSLLEVASDWEILVDYDSAQVVFPIEIAATPERPDITIWSRSHRRVIIVELTCPVEENMEAAHVHKSAKYPGLLAECNVQGWTGHVLPVEVGARGFVGSSVRRALKQLGISASQCRQAVKALSRTAAKCSYYVYQSHRNPEWDRMRPTLSSPDLTGESSLRREAIALIDSAAARHAARAGPNSSDSGADRLRKE